MISKAFLLATAALLSTPLGAAFAQSQPGEAVRVVTEVGVPDGFWDTFESRTAVVGDVNLHYVVGGDGPPLVLLHGFPQTWSEWRDVMPELAQDFTVYAVDLKGSGGSSKPFGTTPGEGYEKVELANEIRLMMEDLGHDQVNVAGHDIGGMVAYAWASAYPGSVRRVAILDVPLPGTEFFQNISQDPRAWHFAFHAAPEVPETLVQGRERFYTEHFIRGFMIDQAAFTDEEFEEIARAFALPGAARGAFEYYRAFGADAEQNAEFASRTLEMPVLALNGGYSESGGVPFEAEMLAGLAADVTGGVIEGSGHWVVEESPEQVVDQLTSFFGEEAPAP